MYTAKADGKNRVRMFTPDMHLVSVRRLDLETHLRAAVGANELVVHYQPIIDLRIGDIHGLEAQVRWDHPERGLLLPSEFIPFAEEGGLIDEINDHVLTIACEQMADWQRFCRPPLPTIAVNISPHQLLNPNYPARVDATLTACRLHPTQLTLEITEGSLMSDPELNATHLHALREVGIRIAVDDFGTGYSAFAYVQQFPVDFLKIDRAFIGEMLTRPGLSIAGAIIQIARTLNVTPIADGLEHEAQANALTALGCDLAQGFHLGRPQNAQATVQLLTARTGTVQRSA